MVRQKRIYYNNAVYHVVFRGNNRQFVLADSKDKEALLKTLSKYKGRFGFKFYGFVLMDNHAHLVLGTDHTSNISKIMQAILLSYSLKFRKKYNYVGHVWQGRFKSNVIEGENYILECLGYIHNNPVRANIASHAQDYSWSSYCFYHKIPNRVIEDLIELDRYGDTSCITY
jgi:REP element-mobilizing transposase RayT